MSKMEEALLALIEAAHDDKPGDLHRLFKTISLEAGGATAQLSLHFGRGYFDPRKVLVALDDDILGEYAPAVAAYMKSVPPERASKR